MQVLGIQFDTPLIRAALLEKKRGQISCLQTAALPKAENVKRLYKRGAHPLVTTGLSTRECIFRSTEVPQGQLKHYEDIVEFQTDALSPLPSSERLLVPYLVRKNGAKQRAYLLTLSRKKMADHLHRASSLGFDPDTVSTIPFALFHYAKWKEPELKNALVIDLGSHEWTVIWIEQGELQKAFGTDEGIEALLKVLWEDRKKNLLQSEVASFAKQIDVLQLKEHLNPSISAKINKLKVELSKMVLLCSKKQSSLSVLFTGRIDALGNLREYLCQGLDGVTLTELHRDIPADERGCAIAIGLGLQTFEAPLQCRREEFFPKKNWVSAGKYYLILGILSVCLSIATLFSGYYFAQKETSAMVETLDSFLSIHTHTNLHQSLFASNNPQQILSEWCDLVRKNDREFPFLLCAPKVAEVLHWLDHHPVFSIMREEGDPPKIKNIHYALVELPTVDALNRDYKAKLNLEFEVHSPTHARKFHEALLDDVTWVDGSEEMQWEALGNHYRVSLILKNRAPHVL
ncbi:MAG: hypothetical protein RL235_457 [Chlamydiota bacterium]|jgi:hypothetical protein